MHPAYIFAFLFFILGAIVGSFLNVVVLRLGTGLPPTGRSQCFSCGKRLGVFDLIPIFSFLALLGRCRYCGARISIQYPIVEALTAFTFLLIYLKFESAFFSPSIFIIGEVLLVLIISSLLIAITAYDVRHKIIPNSLVFWFIGLSAAVALGRLGAQAPFEFSSFLILDLLAGPILFLFFYALWKISKGRWMGLGDGKLALGIGLSLGFVSGLSATVVGFWIGAAFGVSLMLISKVLPLISLKGESIAVTMRTEIPFAPFLILGMAVVYFFGINVLG